MFPCEFNHHSLQSFSDFFMFLVLRSGAFFSTYSLLSFQFPAIQFRRGPRPPNAARARFAQKCFPLGPFYRTLLLSLRFGFIFTLFFGFLLLCIATFLTEDGCFGLTLRTLPVFPHLAYFSDFCIRLANVVLLQYRHSLLINFGNTGEVTEASRDPGTCNVTRDST